MINYLNCNLHLLIHFSAKSTALTPGDSARSITYLYIFNLVDFNGLVLVSQTVDVGHEN